jgi:NADPH2:quinone reductase
MEIVLIMRLPTSMIGVEITRPGGPEVLVPRSLPVPKPAHEEILIAVAAAGVNRPDVMQRQGTYATAAPAGTSPLPGREIAGHVIAMGEHVTNWQIGDPVTALVSGGGYAQYCVAPARHALRIPNGFDMIRAAALPETFFTVWANVFERGKLASSNTLLVHGGASGIGTTAIQLGVAFGARVFTTVNGSAKAAACVKLGAELAIDRSRDDFVDIVRDATGGRGVDVILDMIGGDYVARNLSILAVDGRLVQISFIRGSAIALDLMPVMAKRLVITGSTLRNRSSSDKERIANDLHERVWPLLDSGAISPIIGATFPLSDAPDAHRLMESNSHIGKIMLTLNTGTTLSPPAPHDQTSTNQALGR